MKVVRTVTKTGIIKHKTLAEGFTLSHASEKDSKVFFTGWSNNDERVEVSLSKRELQAALSFIEKMEGN